MTSSSSHSHTHALEVAKARKRRQRMDLARCDEAVMSSRINIDVLRGWSESRDPALRSAHVLPALAMLVPTDGGRDLGLHATELILGHFHPQHGPVDIVPFDRLDYELYQIGAPHVQLALSDEGHWTISVLSKGVRTRIDGRDIGILDGRVRLSHGDLVELGCCSWHFELVGESNHKRWAALCQDLLRLEPSPALFLKRSGSVCGPRYLLDPTRPNVVGRSFPLLSLLDRRHGVVARFTPPDWDLSGLFEHERQHIAFRHILLRPIDEFDWELTVLSTRHHVYINRIQVTDTHRLTPGDEIGLDSVVLHFHHPTANNLSEQSSLHAPKNLEWYREIVGTGLISGSGSTRDEDV